MSRATIADALAELYALFADADGTPVAALAALDVARVLDYEPRPGEVAQPLAVTIFVAGMTPEDWQYGVRIYASRPDAKTQQADVVAVAAAIDSLLGANDGFGPLNWLIGWDDTIGALVAQSNLNCPRNDYF